MRADIRLEGADRLRSKLDAIASKLLTQHDMAELAAQAHDDINQRVTRGKDKNLRPFKGYAASTRKDRKKRGRQVAHVDLNDSGKMMSAITWRTRKGYAKLLFGRAAEAEKAYYHQLGLGRLPKREFFGIDPKSRKTIMGMVQKKVRRVLG